MSTSKALMMVMEAFMETKQDRAVRISREAIAIDPNCKLAYYLLGMIYSGRGLYPLAIRQYQEITTRIDPEDPGIWFLLARQCHLNGQLDEAVRHYQKAYELDPLCDKACLYISQIYCDTGQNLSDALQYAQKAIELRTPECMVDEDVFLTSLKRARLLAQQEYEGAGIQREPPTDRSAGKPDLSNAPVAKLVEIHPHLVAVFTEHGIRCVGCSGYYEDETVRQAANANGVDVNALVHDLEESLKIDATDMREIDVTGVENRTERKSLRAFLKKLM